MRLAICAVISLVAHFVIERGLDLLPDEEPVVVAHTIEIQIITPPPAAAPPPLEPPPLEPVPEPPKPVLPTPVPPPQVPPPRTPTPPPATPTTAPPTPDPRPPTNPVAATDSHDETVFGADMSSSSQTGTGPAVPRGNTMQPSAPTSGSAAATPKPLPAGEPIGAYEATKMPLPQGRCFGKYTPEATAAGTEGTVIMDLTVGEDGRAREIHVTGALSNGLTESAVAALTACRFTPGEKDGHAVPVRIRGFKIRFVLQEAQP